MGLSPTVRAIASGMATLVVCGGFLALLPEYAEETTDYIRENPLTTLLCGLLAGLVASIVGFILALSFVGLVIAVPVFVVLVVVGHLGFLALGRSVSDDWSAALVVAIGVGVLGATFPVYGGIVLFALASTGIGVAYLHYRGGCPPGEWTDARRGRGRRGDGTANGSERRGARRDGPRAGAGRRTDRSDDPLGEAGGDADDDPGAPRRPLSGTVLVGSTARSDKPQGLDGGGMVADRIRRNRPFALAWGPLATMAVVSGLVPAGTLPGSVVAIVATFLLALILCLLTFGLAPEFADGAVEDIRRAPAAHFVYGVGALVGSFVAAVLLFISVIGGLLLVVGAPLLVGAVLAGAGVGTMTLGRTLSRGGDPTTSAVVGAGALSLAAGLPIVGPVAVATVVTVGFGSVSVEVYGRYRPYRKRFSARAGT